MTERTGFLHPGAMGSSVAAACRGERWWISAGRSGETVRRAEEAGLVDAGTLERLVETCDTIVSVCPPDQAAAVADSVADAGFAGVYVDANAISPATAARVGARFDRFVDGGIIGPPARTPGTTRLYLSGDDASTVAERWSRSALETRVIDGGPGAASALKMAFAGWTKGTSALLLAVNALAEAHGVGDALAAEWATSLPDLPERSAHTARGTSPKAWRFGGEMREIAATFSEVDLPDGFHLAAAEVFDRMADLKHAGDVDLATVIDAISHDGN